MITLVTGLWDIGRNGLTEGWSRSYEDHYLKKFDDLLKINNNLIVFGDSELEKFVWERRDISNTQFINRPLEWFKNNEFFNLIQNIRTNPNWFKQSGWLKDSAQGSLEMYNPIVMSKMFLLHDAVLLDKFKSDKLYWIDAGLSNTVNLGYFNQDNVLFKIDEIFDRFMFICFPYDAINEVHGFTYSKMKDYSKNTPDMVARGGFFGGKKENISEMNVLYYSLLKETLSKGFMGTEESIFTIMTYLYPSLIDFVKIESNGLIYKFFEDVKNDVVKVESFRKDFNPYHFMNRRPNDIGLYVITFNSPKQFETLINSFLEYDPTFLNKTKKFLLNNSTDLTTTPEYENLCNKYGFNHIKKDNIGITGGRQFIAEHFNEQENLGYYFFFEDDMFFVNKSSGPCKNGFQRYIPNLFDKSLEIIKKENFDFLKLNYTEFFGSHQTQWSWYNVPSEFRVSHWPEKPNLPEQGYDPDAPCVEFKNIKSLNGLPYASGEIYLSNWPILMTKEGNYNCYLKKKFNFPYEQTLMSHNFQETVKGNIKPGLLLITPTEHNRFDFYPDHLRKEC